MEHSHHEPEPSANFPVVRHDGWTGEKMAIFCEALAETAVVADACDQAGMGISGAYAARRRNPVFAAAWDAALSIARERLADTLLARSIEGNVEQIYRDGVMIGERHVLDNRLGLAILRRLDRLAETGLSPSSRGVRAPSAPAPARQPVDWSFAVEALRIGDDEGVATALSLAKGHEVEEVEGPPDSLIDGHEDEGLDLSDRCWKDGIENIWLTDFPPPSGFTGYENRPYDEDGEDYGDTYQRACTPEEIALLEADDAAARAEEREQEEALRDAWFDMLRDQNSTPREQRSES